MSDWSFNPSCTEATHKNGFAVELYRGEVINLINIPKGMSGIEISQFSRDAEVALAMNKSAEAPQTRQTRQTPTINSTRPKLSLKKKTE